MDCGSRGFDRLERWGSDMRASDRYEELSERSHWDGRNRGRGILEFERRDVSIQKSYGSYHIIHRSK